MYKYDHEGRSALIPNLQSEAQGHTHEHMLVIGAHHAVVKVAP